MTLPRKLEHELRQGMVYLIVLIIFISVVLLFKINLVGILVSVFLMVIAAFSKIYKRFTSVSVGFETVTPTVILFAYKINIFFALAAAFIMLIASSFISGKMDFTSILMEMLTYAFMSSIILAFHTAPFVPLAVGMVIFRNLFMYPLGVVILGRNFFHLLIVIVTDMALNIYLVVQFGNFFASLL
jgi:hypothetical protein